MTDHHWNPPDRLPPVGCPLVILYTRGGAGAKLLVERTTHLQDKSGEMEYRLRDGSTITGRYRWTYP